MDKRTQSGFTLYELLITLLIVGVILTLGVPNLATFTQNSRMTTTANDLHSSFQLARSESVRAKTNITICASNNSLVADPDCAGQLEDGWIIFQDVNGDIAHQAGEAIVRAHPATATGITINNPGQFEYFSYAATGLGRGTVNGNAPLVAITLCDDRGNVVVSGGDTSAARAVVITPIGRSAVLRTQAQVANNGGCP